jgi:hypothetical protein
VISAGTSDIVVLRGLQLQGLGPTGASAGLVGVKINSAASVSIENCVITQFGQQGIFDTRTGGGTRLFVKDTIVSHNAGSGIAIGAGAVNNAEIDNTQSIRNLFGVSTATGNNVMIRRSIFSGNSTAGLESDAGAQLNVNDSTISNNGIGLQTGGVMRVSNSDVAFNTTAVSGSVITWGNNRFSANGSPGTALQPAGAASSDIGQQ